MRFAILVLVATAATLMLAVLAGVVMREPGVECGPEGKPVLSGTACIDREPVSLP